MKCNNIFLIIFSFIFLYFITNPILSNLSHIPTNVSRMIDTFDKRCQCPLTGYLHFYGYCIPVQKPVWMCQCPLTGYLHFYANGPGCRISIFVCQCPLTGYLHFYTCNDNTIRYKLYVSMPFNGLSSFLLIS